MFKNSCILITGGTGTFGQLFLKYVLQFQPREVRIFSRDEDKQNILKQKYQANNIKFIIGDIRDKNSVNEAMKNVDYVLHAAAMKQIPLCETYPLEAFNINVLGSNNVLNCAIENGVKKVVCISTTKAVAPSSIMGLTKACMEQLIYTKAKEQAQTVVCVARFCNLIVSSDSVVPLFIKQIRNKKPLTLTDPNMVRYFMTAKEAIELIHKTFEEANSGEIYIRLSKACTIKDLSLSILDFLKQDKDYPVQQIGARPGEKQLEYLVSQEEQLKTMRIGDYLIVKDHKIEENLLSTYANCFSIKEIVSMIEEDFIYEL